MFAKGSLVRSGSIALVLVAIGAVLMFKFGPNNSRGIMRLRVVNDTERTLKIQPCWDLDCVDRIGLTPTIIPPHHHPMVGGKYWQWENTYWLNITVAVLKPNETAYPPYAHCVVTLIAPKQEVGVIRVTERDMQRCPDLSEGGGSFG